MRIALAQIHSKLGQVDHNVDRHLAFIHKAAALQCELILFPELSITGYGTHLAEELFFEKDDPRLSIFQKVSNLNQITVGVGVPLKADADRYISMFVYQAKQDPVYYSKRFLHDDELPYFQAGDKQLVIEHEDYCLGPAICYESRLSQHAKELDALGVNLYLASVAKPKFGVEKAEKHYSTIAKEYQMTVLMANSIGNSENFSCAGKSGVWLPNGQVLGRLSETDEALLIFDSIKQNTSIVRP